MTVSRETADNIAQWLGGYGPVRAMVGVTQFGYDENSLQFNFKMCRKATHCRITYDGGKDLYNVAFFKLSPKHLNLTPVQEDKDVYGEDLQRIFEEFTGLTLHMPRIRRA